MYQKFYVIFQIYPTHLTSIRPENNLAILYREVPDMLHAKYQPHQPSDSGEEVV